MKIKDLSMSFGTQELFNNVNIQIDENEKVGVVGLNGAGKTTLFKIMLGKEQADYGKITFKNNARVEWLPQVIEDDLLSNEITVLDYLMSARPINELDKELQSCYQELSNNISAHKQNIIYNKINKLQQKLDYWDQYNAETTLLKIITGMNLENDLLDKKISELSGGQKSKVAFAKLLYSNPEVMLLDEPTNHLDKDTKDFIINYLKSYRGGVYIISHDIDFLNEITTKTLFLDKAKKSFSLYDGNYELFIKLHDEEEKTRERQIKIEEQEEAKLREFISKYSSSSGKRKKMVQDREKKLEKLLDKKMETVKQIKDVKIDIPIKRESSKQPLKVDNLSFSYDNNPLIKNLSFSLYRGEKFLIVGRNGIGKSTLLKLIVGELTPKDGNVEIGNKTDIGYYAQEHDLLDNSKSIIDNFNKTDISISKLRNVLGRFLFTGDDVFKKVGVLSPGERSRVALAKLSLSKANFLILDEPTNHLDPVTQHIIADTFKDYKGTMLIVSHNPEFVDNLGVERILLMPSGDIKYYDRNYVMYYSELNNKNNTN